MMFLIFNACHVLRVMVNYCHSPPFLRRRRRRIKHEYFQLIDLLCDCVHHNVNLSAVWL